MIIKVRAKPKSKVEYVKEVEKGLYEVAVKEAPEDGKANNRIAELLAQHFGVSKSKVRLLRGASGKLKLFEIEVL
ncbi:MAG: DUF167 domain-containing protein [Aquificota bacterium]|jgi:uncharacterized protein YggU (UPF0235/DUF167 family)|nr:DUF167 domain-containing protein [Aquificaceae bacterium]MDM7267317.1 DUF167 domain-containing protein [Aquificaceae bacterium]QWK13670.1 MAG: DUF167 domain-containing protein [Aquificota bacterium]HAV40710.1 hypothetical protein [Aquificaceae bacterium]